MRAKAIILSVDTIPKYYPGDYILFIQSAQKGTSS